MNRFDEFFAGYSISSKKISHYAQIVIDQYPHIKKIYSRWGEAWSSRFYNVHSTTYDMLKKLNFSEPQGQQVYELLTGYHDDKYIEKIPVAGAYSVQFGGINLWENLYNMLARYNPEPSVDIIAGFTLIQTYGGNSVYWMDKELSTDMNFKATKDIIEWANPSFTPLSHRDEWNFWGFDVAQDSGYSHIFMLHDPIKELEEIEHYNPWVNRNMYGLFETVEEAIPECRFMNAYDEVHGPYYIWGVYTLKDWNSIFDNKKE